MPGGKSKEDTLRSRTLEEMPKLHVKWDPAWGEEQVVEHDYDASGLVAAFPGSACGEFLSRCFFARAAWQTAE